MQAVESDLKTGKNTPYGTAGTVMRHTHKDTDTHTCASTRTLHTRTL